MNENELKYQVRVDSDELIRLREEVERLEGQAKRAADSVATKWEKTGRNISKVGDGLTKGVTVPLLAVGTMSVKAAIDFESAFAGVIKTVDGTSEQLATLRQGIIDMATEIPASREEIAGVAEAAGQLGIETDNILDFTRVMIDLGEATNLSGADAATALARLANITQMPQSEFDRLGSTVVDLGNNLATTEAEIVAMALRLAGAGSQVGMTEADILSMAGALSSVGIEAEAGGSAVSKVLINMAQAAANGGDQLENFAKTAGMSADDFKRAFEEDAAGAFVAFAQGLQGIAEEGGNVFGVLEDMGITEVRMRDALLRAAGAGDLFSESLAIGSAAWEENNALQREAEQRYETSASQLEILRNKASGVAMEFGEQLIPALLDALDAAEPILEVVGDLVQQFADMDPATQKVVIGIVATTAALGPMLSVTGRATSAVAGLVRDTATLAGQVRNGASALDVFSGSAGSLATAGVVAAGAVGVMIGSFLNTIPAVQDAQQATADWIVDLFDLGRASAELSDAASVHWDEHGNAVSAWAAHVEASKGKLQELRDELGGFQGQVAGIKDATLDLRQANLDVTRAQDGYTTAVKEFGQDSPQAEQASIRLEQAQLRQEVAAKRVKEQQSLLNDELASIPMPDSANAGQWEQYYARIEKAAADAARRVKEAEDALARARANPQNPSVTTVPYSTSPGGTVEPVPRNAAGTIQTQPTLGWTGEDGAEAIINLTNPRYRDRSLELLEYSARALGAGGGIVVHIGAIHAGAGDQSTIRAAAKAGAETGVTEALRRRRDHRGLIGYAS